MLARVREKMGVKIRREDGLHQRPSALRIQLPPTAVQLLDLYLVFEFLEFWGMGKLKDLVGISNGVYGFFFHGKY